jgi:hypothetical protein
MASQECGPEAPWGSQSNFSVEISGGAATMGGSPYSTTGTAAPSPQVWNDFQVSTSAGSTPSNFNVEIDTPAGYKANWNKMTPSANRLGFAGQLNLHYTAVQGAFAGGVYAGWDTMGPTVPVLSKIPLIIQFIRIVQLLRWPPALCPLPMAKPVPVMHFQPCPKIQMLLSLHNQWQPMH